MQQSESEVFASIGIDLAEFERDFKAGKFAGIVKNITSPSKKAAAKKPNKGKKLAAKILAQKDQVVEKPVEIPAIVAYSITELDIHCECGCISSFQLNRNVKRVFKSGRVLYSPAKDFVKETAGLQLPIEKLTSSMEVMQCDNCSNSEDF